MMVPVVFIMTFMITFITYFQVLTKLIDKNGGDISEADKALKIILETVFPFLIPFGIVISSGLYCVTPVRDRELGLRHLLNFAGMRSSSYYLGLMMAELVIFTIPCILLFVIAYLTDLEQFYRETQWLLPTFILFGFPFIALNQLISLVFEK